MPISLVNADLWKPVHYLSLMQQFTNFYCWVHLLQWISHSADMKLCYTVQLFIRGKWSICRDGRSFRTATLSCAAVHELLSEWVNWLGFVLWMLCVQVAYQVGWLTTNSQKQEPYSKTHNTLRSLLTTLLFPGEAKNKTRFAKCSCLCCGSRLLWKQSQVWWRFIFCLVLRQESSQKCVHVLWANVISLVCSVIVMVKIQPMWCFFGHTGIHPLPWPYSLSGYINGYSWCFTLTTGCVMLWFSAESQKDAQSPQST